VITAAAAAAAATAAMLPAPQRPVGAGE
jgi:hypothetical protein